MTTQTRALSESSEGSCFVLGHFQSTLIYYAVIIVFSFFCLSVFSGLGGLCFTVLRVPAFLVFFLADKSPEW